MHRVRAFGRGLFRSGRIDRELAEEMRYHLERETEANLGRGMNPEEARRAAHVAFGSIDVSQERSRDERPGSVMRHLVRDAGVGLRLLARSPVFGVTGLLLVALGIGASTAVFSVVYGVMLRPLPYPDPDRLVSVWLVRNAARNYPAAADALALRELDGVFEQVAFFENENLNLLGEGEPQRLLGAAVSPNLFSALGVSAELGRTFAADEDRPGGARVVVLSHALWRSRFGGERSILGRRIDLDGSPHTVIGIMPPEFQYPSNAHQAWVPLLLDPGELTREATDNYRVVARLAAGATVDRARREVDALASRLAALHRGNEGAGMTVDAMLDDAVRDVRPMLFLLLGGVTLLLLIACANLSNLFAARATARRAEFAVRLALGASRTRLVAQAIAEALPMLLAGGLLGVGAAAWAVRLFVNSQPVGLPRAENIELSGPVLSFSLALLALAGLAASITPAAHAWKSDFTSVTKDGGRSTTAGRGRGKARRVAVAAQVALAVPLLVGATLLVRSAMEVARVDVGFRPERVATLRFEVSRATHSTDARVADYYSRMVDAVRSVPGVATAGLVNRIPLSDGQTNLVRFEAADGRVDELTNVDTRTVTPDYFEALGIRLLAGRGFDERDDGNARPVVIVDERIARTIWPGEPAVGKRMREPEWRGGEWAEVIGVVAHVRTAGLEIDPLPQVYWSHRQWVQDRMVLAVRAEVQPESLVAPVIAAVRTVDPQQSVYDVRTMTGVIEQSQARRRLTTMLMVAFGGVSLLLAAVGIYGVVAFGVMQRTREFGIRSALGATRRQLIGLAVWRETAASALIGAAIGFAGAFAAAGALRSLVYEVGPRDTWSMIGASVLLAIVAGVASYIPARRAALVDPAVTLRTE